MLVVIYEDRIGFDQRSTFLKAPRTRPQYSIDTASFSISSPVLESNKDICIDETMCICLQCKQEQKQCQMFLFPGESGIYRPHV